MKFKLHEKYTGLKDELLTVLNNFEKYESQFGTGKRNKVKVIPMGNETLVVKSFKIPNIINQVAYKFIRPSKAKRSFEYATKLKKLGVNTPNPVAYFEYYGLFGIKQSYYISEYLPCDLTYRELINQPDYPEHERILRAFTKFTNSLHSKGILFLDHSPGNTLIRKNEDGYTFYLVDLNRMIFKELTLDERIKNFSRLTPKREMIQVMSEEYAHLNQLEYAVVHKKMLAAREHFEEKFMRKKRLKKKFLGRK
ncbi:Kdo domain containing protein [Flavobacteriaceae bacterium F08102]|nr:Kdo domain containing protein [Flavobacteriaceae bacterium F08102]